MENDRAFPSLFGRATVAFSGHDALEPLVRALRVLLGEPEAPARERWLAALSPFAERLLSHFDAEETGGYFSTLAEDRPDLAPTVEVLRIEHREMREAVRQVSNLMHRDANVLAVRTLATLLDLLEDHERRESDLIRNFLASAQR